MPSPAPRASRRAVLGGGALAATASAALLTGCGTRDSNGAVRSGAPAVDDDSDLVAEVVGDITAVLTLASATGTAFAGLRPLTRPLVALHRAHLDELGESTDGGKRHVGGTADTARERLARAETKLQGRLVEAALAAESGALAQVFAAMAAAIAQRQAVVA